MICKECGARIKYNEEYCRKCGSLVINFNYKENPTLKNVCIKNNLSGKFRNLINLFFNPDKKHHSFNKLNKDRNLNDFNHTNNIKNMLNINNLSSGLKDISNKVDFYMKDTLGFDEEINRKNSSINEIDDVVNYLKKFLK